MKALAIILVHVSAITAGIGQNRHSDSLRTALTNTSDPIARFDLLNKTVDDIFTRGSGNIDYSLCTEMMRIAQQLNNDSLMAIAYNMAGNYFLINVADFDHALENFFKGIPLAEKANDKRRLSSLYIDISIVYFRLNNPDQQIKYLRLATNHLPPASSSSYHFMLAQVQVYMSRYFITKFNYDSAMHYVVALENTNHILQSHVYGCAALGQKGQIYEKMGRLAEAETIYRRANSKADSVPYFYIKLSVKTPFIEFLVKQGNWPEATRHARQLMNMGKEKNNADVIRMAAGFLRMIAESHQRTDSAYYYSQMESSLKDSVFNQNSINKIQSLVFSDQLRQIENESKKAAEQEKRQRNIQYALIAIGIIIFLILFLLLSHSFIAHPKLVRFLGVVVLLIVFEFFNLLLHPLLEKLTHHNPLLMLVALVCLAAVLVPLHHRLDKWATHKLVEKNKRIRLETARKIMEEAEENKL